MNGKTFTLTEDHLKLLSHFYISWSDAEAGAPSIDCKRPFGNSDVESDIAEIFGLNIDDDPDISKLWQLYTETDTALQIVLITQSFVPGVYQTSSDYDYDWKLVQ